MEDINTMWVWIPRFKVSIDETGYNGATNFLCSNNNYVTQTTCENNGYIWYPTNPNAFDVTFVDTNTSAHEAFTFGASNLSGIWVGKFENSSNISCTPKGTDTIASSALGEDCNKTTIKPLIKPNQASWRGANVSTYFTSIKEMTLSGNIYGFDTSYDTHMMKNSEWGAVTYLTYSIYGRCASSSSCSDIGINNNKNYKTGYGSPAGSGSNSSYASSYVESKSYDTNQGMDASTTGNIYGVYDMSGGAEEYVMGVYSRRIGVGCLTNYPYYKWSGLSVANNRNSGFNGCLDSSCVSTYNNGVSYPDSKYYDVYSPIYMGCNAISNVTLNYTNSKQHALTDTKNWYQDQASFINATAPWFVRGGRQDQSHSAGIFSYHINYGNGTIYYGSRSVLVK